jgi:hypothetical protein
MRHKVTHSRADEKNLALVTTLNQNIHTNCKLFSILPGDCHDASQLVPQQKRWAALHGA